MDEFEIGDIRFDSRLFDSEEGGAEFCPPIPLRTYFRTLPVPYIRVLTIALHRCMDRVIDPKFSGRSLLPRVMAQLGMGPCSHRGP